MFLTLYKSLIRPQLEYANQVWSPRLAKHITMIENVQRRATKLVPELSELTYEERLKELELPTLAYRRLRGDLIKVYKIMSGKCDSEVCLNLINRRVDERSSGHPLRIFKERPNLDLRKYGFPHRVVDFWNRRRMGPVVQDESVKDFEYRLDLVLSDQEILYDYEASAKYTNIRHVIFNDLLAVINEEIEEEETEEPALYV